MQQQQPSRARERGRTIHVLVVDDSKLQRRILCAALKPRGYRVSEAASGEEALGICRADPPDMVISDWMMPGLSGIEFCRAFRSMPRDSYGYFILLTSKSEKEAVAEGLDAGADDFLTKPVHVAELRARIAAGERILGMEREISQKSRMISAALEEIQQLYGALDHDLREARKLQQSLVRERHRTFPGAEVSLMLQPCGHVGGDLVGFFPVDERRVALFSLDVSGHGISSALMTARLAGYLSPTAPGYNVALRKDSDGTYRAQPLDTVVARLNALFLEEMDTEHYFTLILAYADMVTGQVDLVQAGHPHPLILRSGGTIEPIGTGGLPVGLIEAAEYEVTSCRLEPGDRLLLLSDGAFDCTTPGGAMLGEDGAQEMLESLRGCKGPSFLDRFTVALSTFTRGEDFPDDVSAVLWDFAGSPQS
ncbi:sigma-B regulation protein RsbU (phosphoserine phosphatase) [Poseidonocella pacifica]|uniref:Sigma-B regulation protein RsbU (Phosphoserine phosphatase) n=1 Tax=Poseidonocella pacifica TaxID=871651 RepID=A0A1I0XWT8_9RHOB|nr:SpoIIE family protein phosphatase [Poseidonocella pacifica]SFB05107.1 sigma-B regulation protein RsbU (phosphoserine phosphatase) [Poseidonocella pacifica]